MSLFIRSFEDFNEQFRESEDEKRERYRKRNRERTANGQCWQCAKLIAACDCPNITHPKPSA